MFLNDSLISCRLGCAFFPRNQRVNRVVYYISSIEGNSPRSISASVLGILIDNLIGIPRGGFKRICLLDCLGKAFL